MHFALSTHFHYIFSYNQGTMKRTQLCVIPAQLVLKWNAQDQ